MTESRTPTTRSIHRHDERGASLILALVFIVVVAVIVGAISSLTLNDLRNTGKFDSASAQAYSASGVANVAIQTVRYAPQSSSGVLGLCWTTGSNPSELTFNLVQVEIFCETTVNKGSSQSRVVTMYACNTNVNPTGSSCQQNPLLTVVEAYDDYSKLGTDTCSSTNSGPSACGFGATTLAWTWGSLATATGGQSLNAITNPSTAPAHATHGVGSYTPSAKTTSGDPVIITSATPTYCTVSNGVVSFMAAGACTINFDDPGNFNYAPAPEFSQSFTVY
jgi:hypothetical protein